MKKELLSIKICTPVTHTVTAAGQLGCRLAVLQVLPEYGWISIIIYKEN